MNKILIVIMLCAFGLNAQSKLYPNTSSVVKLDQSLVNNTLSLSAPASSIDRVLLFNKETLERIAYDNGSSGIDIDLDKVPAGVYTTMVYLNGDIIVFRIDVKNDGIEEEVEDAAIVEIEKVEEVAVVEKEKVIKFYRAVEALNNGASVSRYNVFTEKRKNDLIARNLLDIASYTGRKNKLTLKAVYMDRSEAVVYETPKP